MNANKYLIKWKVSRGLIQLVMWDLVKERTVKRYQHCTSEVKLDWWNLGQIINLLSCRNISPTVMINSKSQILCSNYSIQVLNWITSSKYSTPKMITSTVLNSKCYIKCLKHPEELFDEHIMELKTDIFYGC